MASIHGYKEYRPTPFAQGVLERVFVICATYEAWNSPLTVRQIFYRLVAEYNYAKTEKDYKALVGWVARSRRARQAFVLDKVERGLTMQEASDEAMKNQTLIPFSWIRDEKGQGIKALTYENFDEVYAGVRDREARIHEELEDQFAT